MRFWTLSLFPELFKSWLESGLIGQAAGKQVFQYGHVHPRDFASGVHQAVDDKVYGGGDGMVQSFLPWAKAIEDVKNRDSKTKIVFLTPQGQLWNQKKALEWLKDGDSYTFVCGRYAGFDERLVVKYADHEISVGDYILNGGELAAMVVMETLLRGLPEVLGHRSSFEEDSFGAGGLLECPSFTRPQEIQGLKVPSFLLSGHHENIQDYRHAVSVVRTHLRRPDILSREGVGDGELKKAYETLESLSEEEKILLGVKV